MHQQQMQINSKNKQCQQIFGFFPQVRDGHVPLQRRSWTIIKSMFFAIRKYMVFLFVLSMVNARQRLVPHSVFIFHIRPIFDFMSQWRGRV